MLQKALVLVLVLASIAGCVSCGGTTSHFVYAAIPNANQIAAFRADPYSGVLTQLSGSPYTVGDGVRSVALHPSGKFLYAANPGQDENDVSLFAINSNGTLNEIFPRTPVGTSPTLVAVDSAGAYLYVANTLSNNISVFSIDSSSGALTAVTGSPFGTNLSLTDMVLSPSGNFLYISAANQPSGVIAVFSITAGVISSSAVSLTFTADSSPTGMVINPTGTYLYAANGGIGNSISIYSIGSNGALTAAPGSPLADTSQHPVALILDPKGQFLYVANQGSSGSGAGSTSSGSNIGTYSITSGTGFPAAVQDSPFASETQPSFLAMDPNGNYLYVGNQTSGGVQAFGNASGSLNAIATYPIGNGITSLAVLP
jgi:6-phosphogluconolactonase (cycloisomerase 2 family)